MLKVIVADDHHLVREGIRALLEKNGNVQVLGEASNGIEAFMAREVLPYAPDAWVDESKTKIGYEISFTRHFYKYVPPRPLAEIDADLEKQVAKIMDLLRAVER